MTSRRGLAAVLGALLLALVAWTAACPPAAAPGGPGERRDRPRRRQPRAAAICSSTACRASRGPTSTATTSRTSRRSSRAPPWPTSCPAASPTAPRPATPTSPSRRAPGPRATSTDGEVLRTVEEPGRRAGRRGLRAADRAPPSPRARWCSTGRSWCGRNAARPLRRRARRPGRDARRRRRRRQRRRQRRRDRRARGLRADRDPTPGRPGARRRATAWSPAAGWAPTCSPRTRRRPSACASTSTVCAPRWRTGGRRGRRPPGPGRWSRRRTWSGPCGTAAGGQPTATLSSGPRRWLPSDEMFGRAARACSTRRGTPSCSSPPTTRTVVSASPSSASPVRRSTRLPAHRHHPAGRHRQPRRPGAVDPADLRARSARLDGGAALRAGARRRIAPVEDRPAGRHQRGVAVPREAADADHHGARRPARRAHRLVAMALGGRLVRPVWSWLRYVALVLLAAFPASYLARGLPPRGPRHRLLLGLPRRPPRWRWPRSRRSCCASPEPLGTAPGRARS